MEFVPTLAEFLSKDVYRNHKFLNPSWMNSQLIAAERNDNRRRCHKQPKHYQRNMSFFSSVFFLIVSQICWRLYARPNVFLNTPQHCMTKSRNHKGAYFVIAGMGGLHILKRGFRPWKGYSGSELFVLVFTYKLVRR